MRSLAAPAPYFAEHPAEREQQPRKEEGQGTTAQQGAAAVPRGQLGNTGVSSP